MSSLDFETSVRCFYTILAHLLFPSDFQDKLGVGVGSTKDVDVVVLVCHQEQGWETLF